MTFQVASRRVINASALIMLFFGILPKFGAVFVSIPDPIIGGSSAALFGYYLQYLKRSKVFQDAIQMS